MLNDHMVPDGICIGFFKTRHLEVSPQDAILIRPELLIGPALQDVIGFMLLKHWHFHLAAPAIQKSDHLVPSVGRRRLASDTIPHPARRRDAGTGRNRTRRSRKRN